MMAWSRLSGILPVSKDFLQRMYNGNEMEDLQDLRSAAGTPSPPAADLGESSLQALSMSSRVKSMLLIVVGDEEEE